MSLAKAPAFEEIYNSVTNLFNIQFPDKADVRIEHDICWLRILKESMKVSALKEMVAKVTDVMGDDLEVEFEDKAVVFTKSWK